MDNMIVYDGSPWFKVHKEDIIDDFGRVDYDFHRISAPKSSIAIICSNDYSDFLLLKEWRPALNAVFYTLPGGAQEPGEDAIGCLLREVDEETSLMVGNVEKIGSTISNGSYFFCEDEVFLCTANLADVRLDLMKESKIRGFEIISWVEFEKKLLSSKQISGVLSALYMAKAHLSIKI
jgi:8-oxo-dGTP pyrophosphatase MutT (NUDIX family)